MEPKARSWSNIKNDGEPGGPSTHEESKAVDADCTKLNEDDVKKPRCVAKVRGDHSISADMKCKGKYRIRVKSSACGCCRET